MIVGKPQCMGYQQYQETAGFTISMPDMAFLQWVLHQICGMALLVNLDQLFTQSLSPELQVLQMHVETRLAKQLKAISHLVRQQLKTIKVAP